MGPLLCSALLALMAIGIMGHGFEPRLVCTSKQKSLMKQQTYLKRQLTRFQWQVTSLRTNCQMEIPDILGLQPSSTAPSPPPVTQEPSTQEPSTQEPSTQEPSTQEPPTQEPPANPPGPTTTEPPKPEFHWPERPPPGYPPNAGSTPPPDPTPQFPVGPPGTQYFPIPPFGQTYYPPLQPGYPGYPGWPPNHGYRPGVPGGVWPPSYMPGVISYNVSEVIMESPEVIVYPSPSIISTQPVIEYILTPKDVEEDSKLTTVMIIKKYSYPVETHFVTTQDGYILCLHRIPRPGAPVILLVHGLMSSSVIWVQMGPSNGLAFKLYNQGYDVWLLNTRGNLYSQQHRNPNIKPSKYWAFSFHEIGVLDLPATIDMVISVSKQQQIQYIGHSQGSTAFFVMCSELPQYAEKIILMQALSPTVFMQNTQSPVLRFLNLFKGKFGVLLNLLGGLEISRDNTLIAQFRNHICSANIGSQICAIFDYVMCGFGWSEFNTNLTQLVVGHSSQGASSVQIYHYAQLLNGQKFHRFDKGALLNSMTYKGSDPPSYNLTSCTCKVALHYSEDDWLAGPQDVAHLKDRLPNVVDNSFIPQKGFSHYDYMLSQNVNRLLYGRVINNVVMNRYFITTQTQTFVQPVVYQYQQII